MHSSPHTHTHAHNLHQHRLTVRSLLLTQAYFITDNEPLGYFDFNSKFASYFGTSEFKVLPRLVPIALAYVVETIAWLSKYAHTTVGITLKLALALMLILMVMMIVMMTSQGGECR
jgi:hypothetical protein